MADANCSNELTSQPIEEASRSLEIGSSNPQPQPQGSQLQDPQPQDTTSTQGGKLKSVVWNHFKKVQVNGEDKAQCNYCRKLLGGKSKNGTKHLHQHMDLCFQRKISMRGQTVLTSQITKGKAELTATTYDSDNAKKELAHAIILHEYPLSIVDHVGFKRYSNALQPVFNVPSRNTIKKEIMKVYDAEKSIALKLIDSNEGRVAITSDMWTSSNQKRGYMAITAHYIDSSWSLQSQILR